MIPRAASEYERDLDSVLEVALRSIRRAWRALLGRNWERTWRSTVGPQVNAVLVKSQATTVTLAEAYVASVLAELDLNPADAADVVGVFNPAPLLAVAGDGTPTDSLTYGAVVTAAKAQYQPGLVDLAPTRRAELALDEGQSWMDEMVTTILADAARAAEAVATAQRPWVTGYVRMVEPGACSRCVILAGAFYRYNDGFLRHPKCRCRHIPADENVAGDLRTDPLAYFESLSKAEQDRMFTVAGAEAIRLGADMGQVVRARRGMRYAQVYGRNVLITTEGTTSRGLAGKTLGDLQKVANERYRRSRTPRLMPETILAHAKNPEDALRLLRRFGFVL